MFPTRHLPKPNAEIPLVYRVISDHIVDHVLSHEDLALESKTKLLRQAIDFYSLEALDLLSTLFIASRKIEDAYNLVMQYAHKFGLAGQYIKFVIFERLAFLEPVNERKFILIYSALRTAIELMLPNEEIITEDIMHYLETYFEKMQKQPPNTEKLKPVHIIKNHIKTFLMRVQNEEELLRLQLEPDNQNLVQSIQKVIHEFHEIQNSNN